MTSWTVTKGKLNVVVVFEGELEEGWIAFDDAGKVGEENKRLGMVQYYDSGTFRHSFDPTPQHLHNKYKQNCRHLSETYSNMCQKIEGRNTM